MRQASALCAPFCNGYDLLPLLYTNGQLHHITIRYRYCLPTLLLGQCLGVNEGLLPAHNTSTDSEHFILHAPSFDEVLVACGDLETLVSNKHKVVPLQHVEPGFIQLPHLDHLEHRCQVRGKARTKLALGWQSKRVLQCM